MAFLKGMEVLLFATLVVIKENSTVLMQDEGSAAVMNGVNQPAEPFGKSALAQTPQLPSSKVASVSSTRGAGVADVETSGVCFCNVPVPDFTEKHTLASSLSQTEATQKPSNSALSLLSAFFDGD